jgi:hypothetical protein
MLNSGKKIRALSDKKNKYSNSCVVRKKNSERNKKPLKIDVSIICTWSLFFIWFLSFFFKGIS